MEFHKGSILGPALFILYVNDMCNVSTTLKSILFADDTNIFHTGDNLKEVCETMSHELDKLNLVVVWMVLIQLYFGSYVCSPFTVLRMTDMSIQITVNFDILG